MAEFIGFLLFAIIPLTTTLLYYLDMLCLGLFITIFVLLILLFVGVPVIFYYSTSFRRLVVFLNSYENPRIHDFSDPSVMLPGTRNLYIPVGENDKLGVWHILSNKSMHGLSYPIADSVFNETLKNNTQFFFIYLHGNSNTRAGKHRMELYKVLRKRGHVLALDYRGYADSTNRHPTETQLLEDALAVHNWLLNEKTNHSRIVVWGHSLGTAVAINLCTHISTPIEALVLEAPFTNMVDEVRSHPLSKLFSWLPYYERLIIEPFRVPGAPFTFKSDEKIKNLNVSRMAILHAKDDNIVPFKMGDTMYNLKEKYHPVEEDQLIAFDEGGHDGICQQPDFETKFIDGFLDLIQ